MAKFVCFRKKILSKVIFFLFRTARAKGCTIDDMDIRQAAETKKFIFLGSREMFPTEFIQHLSTSCCRWKKKTVYLKLYVSARVGSYKVPSLSSQRVYIVLEWQKATFCPSFVISLTDQRIFLGAKVKFHDKVGGWWSRRRGWRSLFIHLPEGWSICVSVMFYNFISNDS